ncbi:TPA: hypothetical protein N0F65_003192 [Lagenidium giganteum]|uniref:Uncharacterized protein n=1 Tax=Lagenidium giganteum TaxID=4803 RepID=A0AAV2ZC08_9STRA|nr:TPA: hypothetical protein N0F65_003192 [Lagenidium giganteum]
MVSFTKSLAVIPLLCAIAAAQFGGWHDDDLTDSTRQVLLRAVGSESFYKAGVQRVCVSEIKSVKSQVVSGSNYKFQVTGCVVSDAHAIGVCTTASCPQPKKLEVEVFDQPWTQTLSVTGVSARA